MNNDIDIERHTRKLNEEKLTKKEAFPRSKLNFSINWVLIISCKY